jgi:DNA helicase IV
MAHKYDPFYRLLCDAKVVQAQAIREAEALGLTTTLEELQHCHAVLTKIANNVMTKIEAAHIETLMEKKEERRTVHVTVGDKSATVPAPNLSLQSSIDALRASGLNPIVIDEDTDFDALTRQLNLKESNDDSCAATAEGHSTSAAADAACEAPVPEAPQGDSQ